MDGLSDAGALAKEAGLRELELRVVLRTLHQKQVIDFADEPLSDADLERPSPYHRLGIILMRERADYRRAETLIRKAIELAPDNTVYTTNLQQVLSQQAVRSHRG